MVSILHAGKGPNTTQTQSLKVMKINTIKNLVHQEKKFQLPIKILYCNDEITLNILQNNLCIITDIKRLIFLNKIETDSFRGPERNNLVTDQTCVG